VQRILLLVSLAIGCGKTDKATPPPTPTPTPAPTPANATSTAFVDVTLVPMDSDHELAHQTVVVDGDKIVAIGPVASTTVPAGATKIDGAGKWLVPGLVDMHVHFNDERDGVLYVANGITTVRNMWGGPPQLEWRDKARKHDPSYFGPAIYTAGPIVDGDPAIWPGSTVIHDAAEAIATVDSQKHDGYDFVKVYDGIPLAAYDALAAEAKKQGIRFAGHLPKAVSLEHAFAAGQASIEHLTGYFVEAQDASSKVTTLKGDERRAELGKHLDASKIPTLAKQTAAAKVANCPTLTVMSRFGQLDHPDVLMARPENKFVSPATLERWDPKHDFRLAKTTPEGFAAMRATDGFRAQLVKALAAEGAPILAGTDTPNPFVVPGFSLLEELGRLVAAGLTPYQALQAATANAGDWIGDRTIGRIAIGGHADLVLLDADPLVDIAATTKRTGVMVRGQWLTAAALAKKLDELVASFQPSNRFAKLPALEVPAGDVELRATYLTTVGKANVGAERVAVVKTKDGRIVVAQASGDPPSPKTSAMKLELDAAGHLRSYTLEEDGKTATATVVADKLHVVAATPSDTAFPADGLIDGTFISLMIPFLAHTKPHETTKVAAKQLAGDGTLTEIAYTFDRTADPIKLAIDAPGLKATGTLAIDANGFPTRLEVVFPFGPVVITRE
jgi:imidazolonepropionase-like amidohydrolase